MAAKPLPDADGFAAAHGRRDYDGHHYEWKRDPKWRVRRRYEPSMRCRWTDHGQRCEATAKAAMNRGTRSPIWWWYCPKHLYGRLLWDGVVYSLILVADEPERP